MVCLFLADAFEIIEAMAPLDMLTRAGIDVKTVGVTGKTVTASCGVPITADITAEEFVFENIEAVILPGGMPGTLNLENSQVVQQAIDKAVAAALPVCAICAAPSVLGHKGLLEGKKVTAFPGFEEALYGAELAEEYVVTDGNFITARGAGVCIEFGLAIVKRLKDEATAEAIRRSIQCAC